VELGIGHDSPKTVAGKAGSEWDYVYLFFCTSFEEIVVEAAAERADDLRVGLRKGGAVLVVVGAGGEQLVFTARHLRVLFV